MTEEESEEEKERARKVLLERLKGLGLPDGHADVETSNLNKSARRYFNDVVWHKVPDPNDRTAYKKEIMKSVADLSRFWLVSRGFRGMENKRRELEWMFPARYILEIVEQLARWMPEDYTIAVIDQIAHGLDDHYAMEDKQIKAHISVNLVYKYGGQSFAYDYEAPREYEAWKRQTERKGCAFVLPLEYEKHLVSGRVNNKLRAAFEERRFALTDVAKIIKKAKQNWRITDGSILFSVKRQNEELVVFKGKGWGAPRKGKRNDASASEMPAPQNRKT